MILNMMTIMVNSKRWEFCDDTMMNEVYYLNGALHIDPFQSIPSSVIKRMPVDGVKFFPITDGIKMQLAVVSHNNKYGVYTLHGAYGMGGSGTYVNPDDEAFPFDEVVAYDTLKGFCYVAVKKANKWGIIKVVDCDYQNKYEYFTHIYGATKRVVVVPCEYDSIDTARQRLFVG